LSTTPPTNAPDDEQPPAPIIEDEEYPVDRLRSRLNESLGGRPLTVYLVLFAGAATLLLLLAVVWISAQGGGEKDELICTEIAPADARAAVLGGQVQRINILVDKDDPMQSLTGVQLRFTDGSCRQTPQGAALRDELFSIIGAVNLYNEYSDSSIRIHYQSQNIQLELLITPTPTTIPTETPSPTVTTEPTATAEPTSPPTPSPTHTPAPTHTAAPTEPATVSPTRTTPALTPTVSGGQRVPVGNPGA
jgi:hypothetical protein